MTELVFPPSEGPIDPSWWAPLLDTIDAIDGAYSCRYRLLPSDFACSYKAVRRGRPDVYAYQHRWTRRYLHLDAEMHPYRYVATRHPADQAGRYLRHRNLDAALVRLALWDTPWARYEVAIPHEVPSAETLRLLGEQPWPEQEEQADGRLHVV